MDLLTIQKLPMVKNVNSPFNNLTVLMEGRRPTATGAASHATDQDHRFRLPQVRCYNFTNLQDYYN